jgi:hypothetical protein
MSPKVKVVNTCFGKIYQYFKIGQIMKEKQELLFTAIKNSEMDLIKRLVEDEGIELGTMGENIFHISSGSTILGYTPNVEIMEYILDRGVIPTAGDLFNLMFQSKESRDSFEVFKYLYENFEFELKEDRWDNELQTALDIDENRALELKIYFRSINRGFKDVYLYIKDKIGDFNINDEVKESIYSDKITYIASWQIKSLSRKCRDNKVFTEVELKGKSAEEIEKRILEVEKSNQKQREWLSFLLDEGMNPFNKSNSKDSNISLFTYFVLNRELDLIKKSLDLYSYVPRVNPDGIEYEIAYWDTYCEDVDILNTVVNFKSYSNYYVPSDDPEVYRYEQKPELRDEILQLFAEKGFPFYKSEIFLSYLKGSTFVKVGYRDFDVKLNSEWAWNYIKNFAPEFSEPEYIFYHTSFSDEQLELLSSKGYGKDKGDMLLELVKKMYDKYSLSSRDELLQKAQKMIDDGVRFKEPMQLLEEYSHYYHSYQYSHANTDYTELIDLIVKNDLISEDQFKGYFEDESIGRWDKQRIFEHYKHSKEPLFHRYKAVINSLDTDLKKEYFIHACLDDEEGYSFLRDSLEQLRGNENYQYYHSSIVRDLESSKNWELLRGFIKLDSEFNLLNGLKISFNTLLSLIKDNAPRDILEWYDRNLKIDDRVKLSSYEELELIINSSLANSLQALKDGNGFNVVDKYSKTILHYACEGKSIEKIHKLLDIGFPTNIRDRYDRTPFDSFLKGKPDEKDDTHFQTFKRLLKHLLREGGTPSADAIKPIRAKKFKAYHQLLEDYSEIEDELNQESSVEEREREAYENELVEVTIYRTEVSTHYHRYKVVTEVPRKDLVLDNKDLIDDYYDYDKEDYDSDWDSSSENEWEVEK